MRSIKEALKTLKEGMWQKNTSGVADDINNLIIAHFTEFKQTHLNSPKEFKHEFKFKVGDEVKIKKGTHVYYAGINYKGDHKIGEYGIYSSDDVFKILWLKYFPEGTKNCHYGIIKKIDDREPCITLELNDLIFQRRPEND